MTDHLSSSASIPDPLPAPPPPPLPPIHLRHDAPAANRVLTEASANRILAEAVRWYLGSRPETKEFETMVFRRTAEAVGEGLSAQQLASVAELVRLARDLSVHSAHALLDTLHAIASAAGVIQERDRLRELANMMRARIAIARVHHRRKDHLDAAVGAAVLDCPACEHLAYAADRYDQWNAANADLLPKVENVAPDYNRRLHLPATPPTLSQDEALRLTSALGFHPFKLRSLTLDQYGATAVVAKTDENGRWRIGDEDTVVRIPYDGQIPNEGWPAEWRTDTDPPAESETAPQ